MAIRAEEETRRLIVVDDREAVSQHYYVMATDVHARARRSSRVFMRVRVVLAGKNKLRKRFRVACETIVINAHGGLIYVSQPLEMSAMLMITNPFTQEEQECRVVYLGEETDKAQLVGIEFLTPAPHFWGVEFTQPDWHRVPVPSNSSQSN